MSWVSSNDKKTSSDDTPTRTHAQTHTRPRTHTCTYTQIYTHKIQMYTRARARAHTHTHTHLNTHTHTAVCTRVPCMASSPEVSGDAEGVALHALHIPLLLLKGFLKSLSQFLHLYTAFASGFDPISQPYTRTHSLTWYACSRQKTYEA